ncbi:putative FAD-dependent oxygenase [Nemania sp. NC0429]|nr:putative FAD-dependent oxygenase [Nemania sp. NC0429]
MRGLPTAFMFIQVLGAVSCSINNTGCVQKLKDALSPAAAVYLPGSTQFQAATARWSEFDPPTPAIVVVPATEDDVAQAVRQANTCGLPFLAFNGGHGSIGTLGRMHQGVAIDLSQLRSVVVSQDGNTATIGGGALAKNVTIGLWAAGKQTVTGTCECVSYLGPALGGGRGWLQGHYGLVADQLVSVNIVLADGSQQTVSGNASSDLFWALKGAGHNFGIITSVTSKVYDIQYTDWAVNTLIFAGDKVGAVYETANKYLMNQPANIINWSYWLNIADIDPENPVIVLYIIQEGAAVVDSQYTQLFLDIGPVSSMPMSGTYLDLATWTGIDEDAPPCQKNGLANPRFPIYLDQYDVPAQKQAYSIFAAYVGGANSSYTNSIFMFEGYSLEGVRNIDDTTSAFAFRNATLLASLLLTYDPSNQTLDGQAAVVGNQLRDILFDSSGSDELRAYVNYAYGNENPKNWYGHEMWRQQRLASLKEKYDPLGRFSFYAPIEQNDCKAPNNPTKFSS